MSRMDEAREAAKELFLTGWSQRQIATALKVSENTISKWGKQGEWKANKLRYDSLTETSTQKLMEVYDYQATCLHKMVQQRIAEADYSGLDNGVFDALNKAYKPIMPQHKEFKTYASIAKEVLDYIQSQDVDAAKLLEPILTDFLNSKRSLL